MSSVREVLLKPISLVYFLIVFSALFLLIPAVDISDESGMLSKLMLVLLVCLSLFSLFKIAKQAYYGEFNQKAVLKSPIRVFSSLLAMVMLVACIDAIGFYPTIIVFVPLISYFFGCKNLKVLAISTAIFVSLIYLVFSFAMSKEFPTGWII